MKLTTLLAAACAASAILLTSCGDSENEALERFKKDAEALKADAKAMQSEAAADPATMMSKARAMMEKLLAIKTEGLPEDLKSALKEAQSKIASAKDVLAEIPAGADLKGMMEKAATDPAMMEKLTKIQTEFPKLMEAVGPAMEKVEQAARKHGINLKD